MFSKTKMCKFFILGMCSKGAGCRFAHQKEDLNPLPDLSRTKLCKSLINTGSCEDPECSYAHNREELRGMPNGARCDDQLLQMILAAEEQAKQGPAVEAPPAQVMDSSQQMTQLNNMLTWLALQQQQGLMGNNPEQAEQAERLQQQIRMLQQQMGNAPPPLPPQQPAMAPHDLLPGGGGYPIPQQAPPTALPHQSAPPQSAGFGKLWAPQTQVLGSSSSGGQGLVLGAANHNPPPTQSEGLKPARWSGSNLAAIPERNAMLASQIEIPGVVKKRHQDTPLPQTQNDHFEHDLSPLCEVDEEVNEAHNAMAGIKSLTAALPGAGSLAYASCRVKNTFIEFGEEDPGFPRGGALRTVHTASGRLDAMG